MIFEILKMVLTPILTLIIGSLGTWIATSKTNKKQADKELYERLKLVEDANRAILHETILKKCNQLLMIGSITPEELDEIEYLYKPYRALNGNHRAEKAYNKVLDLPRVKSHEHEKE